ncbi:hypothetical protein LW14_27275 [Rhizobium sp. H41]|nr:hypothetical protein LW14_27275 [Rhizobium sp. H41]
MEAVTIIQIEVRAAPHLERPARWMNKGKTIGSTAPFLTASPLQVAITPDAEQTPATSTYSRYRWLLGQFTL